MAYVRAEDVCLRPESYSVLKVPPAGARAILRRLADVESPFLVAVREADMLSLVLSAAAAAELGDLLADATREAEPYRVLTFAPALPWNLVGFLARVTAVLAEAGIPLGAVAAYDRDHLFLRASLAERTAELLRAAAREGRLL